MDCDLTLDLGSPEHLGQMMVRMRRDRVPVSGAFDLTYRCNFRCVHCYAGHLVAQRVAEADELRTDEVLHLLSEAASAGLLNLLLSGGEPLLRPDFIDLYTAARRLGLLVTVFTNGSLLDRSHFDAFREYPPHMVEISIYGATARTYERITGIPGAFARTMRNVDLLVETGVRVGLKTMILRDNAQEVEAIEGLARGRGLRFRLDPLITPRLNRDPAPLAQRVEPGLAVSLELRDGQRRATLAAFAQRQNAADAQRGWDPRSRVYRCGAGLSTFNLDPTGVLRPCFMMRGMSYNTQEIGFAAAWRQIVAAVDGLAEATSEACVGCSEVYLCGYCPGLSELETGSMSEPPEYVCSLSAQRSALLEGEREVEDVAVR